jgi:integrase
VYYSQKALPPFRISVTKSRTYVRVQFLDPETKQYGNWISSGVTSKTAATYWAKGEISRRGMLDSFTGHVPTVYEYLEHFWDDDGLYANAVLSNESAYPLSEHYLRDRQSTTKNWVLTYPPFKALHLDELNAGIIQQWKTWIRKSPAKNGHPDQHPGTETIRNCYMTLSKPVNYFFDSKGMIPPRIRITKIGRPKKSSKERYATISITLEQGLSLFTLTTNEDDRPDPGHQPSGPGKKGLPAPIHPRIKIAILLAAFSGLRKGEIIGLQWDKLDFEMRKRVNVDQQIADGSSKLSPPKDSSIRQTVLLDALIEELKAYAKRSPHGKKGYVLADWRGSPKTPISAHAIDRGWRLAKEQLGLDASLRFHDLRHFFISYCFFQGLPVTSIAELAGQASIKVTALRYGGNILTEQQISSKLQIVKINAITGEAAQDA